MNDKIKYFLDAWEMNGVGKTVARVQDGPGTVVTLTVDDLRSLAASASAEPDDYKRMFEDAVRSLAAIDEALGIDPDEAGGAAPILEAIAKLKIAASASAKPVAVTDDMVSRFLGWNLPQDFYPDCYIAFDREKASQGSWPVGTNLLHAEQARAMLEHVIAAPAIDAAHGKSQADLPCPTCGGEVAKRFNILKDDNSQAVALSERERFGLWLADFTNKHGHPPDIDDAWQARAALSAPVSMSAEPSTCLDNSADAARIVELEKEIEVLSAENRPAQDDVQACHKCGLPKSVNPHPEAGKPPHYLEVGCPTECIPCLSKSRHGWAQRAMKDSRDAQRYRWLSGKHGLGKENLDEQIDAAIASQSAKEPK